MLGGDDGNQGTRNVEVVAAGQFARVKIGFAGDPGGTGTLPVDSTGASDGCSKSRHEERKQQAAAEERPRKHHGQIARECGRGIARRRVEMELARIVWDYDQSKTSQRCPFIHRPRRYVRASSAAV
jgi:hypothetical protein